MPAKTHSNLFHLSFGVCLILPSLYFFAGMSFKWNLFYCILLYLWTNIRYYSCIFGSPSIYIRMKVMLLWHHEVTSSCVTWWLTFPCERSIHQAMTHPISSFSVLAIMKTQSWTLLRVNLLNKHDYSRFIPANTKWTCGMNKKSSLATWNFSHIGKVRMKLIANFSRTITYATILCIPSNHKPSISRIGESRS